MMVKTRAFMLLFTGSAIDVIDVVSQLGMSTCYCPSARSVYMALIWRCLSGVRTSDTSQRRRGWKPL